MIKYLNSIPKHLNQTSLTQYLITKDSIILIHIQRMISLTVKLYQIYKQIGLKYQYKKNLRSINKTLEI